MPKPPPYTLVLPHDREPLERTLEAVQEADPAPSQTLVIHLAGTSEARRPGVTHLDLEHPDGPPLGASLNMSALVARTPVLVFLHPACVVAPDAPGRLAHHAALTGALVGGTVRRRPAAQGVYELKRVETFDPRFFALTTRVYWDLGGFDGPLLGWRHIAPELGARARRQEVPIYRCDASAWSETSFWGSSSR